MCCATNEEQARKTAHRYFRWSAELPHEAVGKAISCGPSVDRHLAAIEKYASAGYDHIILSQIGPDQDFFFDLFERKLMPALRGRQAA
jgi:hypothetical protein